MNANYAKGKLKLLLRDIDNYDDGEFWREMSRIAYGSTTGQPNAELLKLDSDRWNAFMNSPIRVLGMAGLDPDDPAQPSEHGKDGYAHFGCEIWTKHSGYTADRKDLLIGFADQAIRAQAKEGE